MVTTVGQMALEIRFSRLAVAAALMTSTGNAPRNISDQMRSREIWQNEQKNSVNKGDKCRNEKQSKHDRIIITFPPSTIQDTSTVDRYRFSKVVDRWRIRSIN